MIDRQVSRRNSTAAQKAYMIGARYTLEKKLRGGRADRGFGTENFTVPNTAEKIAADVGLSERTVRSYGDFAIGVDHLASQSDNPYRTEARSRSGIWSRQVG